MNPVQTAHTLDLVRRARRLRRTSGIRELVRETRLSAEQFLYPLFVATGTGVRREVPSMPGVFQLSVDEAVRETEAARATAFRACCCSDCPRRRTTSDRPPTTPTRPCRAPCARSSAASPDTVVVTDVCLCEYTSHGHCGMLDGTTCERRDGRAARARSGVARRRRRRHRRAVGHDGRPRRRHPEGARRARLRERRDHVVRREVLLGLLRAVPRCGRLGAAVRRPPHAPDGSRQRRRSAARSRAGHRRRRRHRHGEAGDAVSGRRAPREGHVRLSDGRVSGERRVLDDQGRGGARLARRAARHDGVADVDRPRRRRHHHHVLRSRRGARASRCWLA